MSKTVRRRLRDEFQDQLRWGHATSSAWGGWAAGLALAVALLLGTSCAVRRDSPTSPAKPATAEREAVKQPAVPAPAVPAPVEEPAVKQDKEPAAETPAAPSKPVGSKAGAAEKARKNDTRAGLGLGYEEVLALHKELRGLVDIHKVPSKREMEIWRLLASPGFGGWPYSEYSVKNRKPGCAFKVENGKVQLPGMASWGTGGHCMRFATMLYTFAGRAYPGERFYLDICTQQSDALLDQLNDPVTGHIVGKDGVRAPLQLKGGPRRRPDESGYELAMKIRRAKANPESEMARELEARPKEYRYEWLSNGVVVGGIATTAEWILDHPEVHNLPAPQIPGQKVRTGDTYLAKAKFWLSKLKILFDHFEKYRTFDDKRGVWVSKPRETDVEFLPIAMNRFMIFNQAYLTTGSALVKMDPVKYAAWYKRAKYVARRGFEFLKASVNPDFTGRPKSYPKENKYGPLYVWEYRRLSGTSEDLVHLSMELGAMLTLQRYDSFFSAADWKAVANMVYSGLYNYDTHTLNKGIFRDPQPRGKAVFRVYSPPFGALIGKYMPDEAYEKFMAEQLFLWDERLERGELGRIDTYHMHFDILTARLNRYGKDPWLKLPDATK